MTNKKLYYLCKFWMFIPFAHDYTVSFRSRNCHF